MTQASLVQLVVIFLSLVLAEPTERSLWSGAAFVVIGEFLRIWAAGHGYRKGQVAIVGPWRFVRHPYFLGTILLHAGLVVASRSLVATIVGLVLLLLIYRREVVRDEALLAEKLGQIFKEYKSAVGAFLPQFYRWTPAGGVPQARTTPFSLRTAILEGRKRELDALVAGGVVFTLLVIASQTSELLVFRIGAVLCVGLFVGFRFIYYWRIKA